MTTRKQLDQEYHQRIVAENDELGAEIKRLTDENEELAEMFDQQSTLTDKAEDERDALREQLRWEPSEDQIMAAIRSSNCGLKRVKWKDGIDIDLPSGEAIAFVAAILEFRPKQDKGSDV